MPKRGYGIQTRVSTPGIAIPATRSPERRKIERRTNRHIECSEFRPLAPFYRDIIHVIPGTETF
jgi:hypothetical protein